MKQTKIELKNVQNRTELVNVLEYIGLPIVESNSNSEDNNLVIDNKEDLSFYKLLRKIVEEYVQKNINVFHLDKPSFEGESKKFFVHKNLALIELKPTMYSFTYNRYGVVENTDLIRLKFWRLFAEMLNQNSSNHVSGVEKDDLIDSETESYLKKDFPFISNYLGHLTYEGKEYAIVYCAKSIPPLEIVWKNYLVGTMKHNLKKVDNYKTKDGKVIHYESTFPNDFIRFDWRNPLPDKDECIPDDFAEFYIDSKVAKKVASVASLMLNRMLKSKGYELVDLCYFMNYSGNVIHSEITPDGMRIKNTTGSFDKDLWRQGKDKDTIVRVWTELYEDLRK